jgi:hypothetical protein
MRNVLYKLHKKHTRMIEGVFVVYDPWSLFIMSIVNTNIYLNTGNNRRVKITCNYEYFISLTFSARNIDLCIN